MAEKKSSSDSKAASIRYSRQIVPGKEVSNITMGKYFGEVKDRKEKFNEKKPYANALRAVNIGKKGSIASVRRLIKKIDGGSKISTYEYKERKKSAAPRKSTVRLGGKQKRASKKKAQ